MKQLTTQLSFSLLFVVLFSLSYAQIRILSTTNSFQGTFVAFADAFSRDSAWTFGSKYADRALTAATAFIGLSSIDVQTSTVDYEITFQTASVVDITLQLTAGPDCAVNSVQLFVLSAFDCKLHCL